MNNERVDWRFLAFVFVFGLAVAGGTATWLNNGAIAIKQGSPRGSRQQVSTGPVVGNIPSDHVLYYPLCATWGLLAGIMIVLPVLAGIFNSVPLAKTCAWSCVALLLLGFSTVGLALLVTKMSG